MVPILQKCHIYICMETIHYLRRDLFEWHHFFVLGTDQTYHFEWHRIFYIGHRFPRKTFIRLIKLIMTSFSPFLDVHTLVFPRFTSHTIQIKTGMEIESTDWGLLDWPVLAWFPIWCAHFFSNKNNAFPHPQHPRCHKPFHHQPLHGIYEGTQNLLKWYFWTRQET